VEIHHIFFLVNQAAGKDEPVLEMIRETFHDSGHYITVHVLEENEDPAQIVRGASKGADLIAVYGGDGTVTKAASALIGTKLPLAIIPGGTANVLSKDLKIPQDTEDAIKIIRDGKFKFQRMDTGLVNGQPFVLRVNLGIMAEMITGIDPALKDEVGQLAYGISTIKSLRTAEPVIYYMIIDGMTVEATGVSLTVTNSGSLGIGDLQLQPGISAGDGLLDVLLLKDAGIFSIIKAAGGSLLGLETDAVSHWTCKMVTITLPNERSYLRDDGEERAAELAINIVPASLTVALPITEKHAD
jgi:diacylglycerol kinase (ATP)